MFIYLNNSVSGLLVYGIVLSFFIVLTYVYMKHTDDFTLSATRSLFATIVIATLFYYMGRIYNVSLFDGNILLMLIVVSGISASVLYFYRHQING